MIQCEGQMGLMDLKRIGKELGEIKKGIKFGDSKEEEK